MMNHTDKSIRNDKADIIKPFLKKKNIKGLKKKESCFVFLRDAFSLF